MLLPEGKVNAVLRVALLPPKFYVLGQLTHRHVLHDVVAVQDLLISPRAPIIVHTKRLRVPQRHRLLPKAEIGEIVFQLVRGEVLVGDLFCELAFIVALPLGVP